MTANDQLQFYV